jgi:hypothetical protein
MYRNNQTQQITFDLALPFDDNLKRDNHWVILADLTPWDQVEKPYALHFENSDTGCPDKPARVALGALIID